MFEELPVVVVDVVVVELTAAVVVVVALIRSTGVVVVVVSLEGEGSICSSSMCSTRQYSL